MKEQKPTAQQNEIIFIDTIFQIDKLCQADAHKTEAHLIEGKKFIKFFVPTIQQFAYAWANPLIDGKAYKDATGLERPVFAFMSEDLKSGEEIKETRIRSANKAEIKNIVSPLKTVFASKETKPALVRYKITLLFIKIGNFFKKFFSKFQVRA